MVRLTFTIKQIMTKDDWILPWFFTWHAPNVDSFVAQATRLKNMAKRGKLQRYISSISVYEKDVQTK